MRLSSNWTAQPPLLEQTCGYHHFRCLGERGEGPTKALELEAVLNRRFRLVVTVVELGQRNLWQPGWQQLARPMQIIPAIDLLDGHCVRLHQGDYGQVTRFSNDPVAQALAWQEQGAQRLHLVDLDGAKSGEPVNDGAVKAITSALAIPVQLGGGVRTAERAAELLGCGLDRVILGTVALEQPELVDELAATYPGKIVVGIDAKNGKVATRGWIEESSTEATALAKRFNTSGIAAIISTDIATDGTLAGPNLEALRAMAEASAVPVIASGGIGNLEHLLALLALAPLGIEGVIVGRALYDGRVDLAEAIQAIGDGRFQDPIDSNLA